MEGLPELVGFLEGLQQQGKIRAFGLATDADASSSLLHAQPGRFGVAQFGSDVFAPNVARVRQAGVPAIITHSPFGGGPSPLIPRVLANTPLVAELTRELGEDFSDGHVLSRYLLAAAVWVARPDVTVCSMFGPGHIEQNVRAVEASQGQAASLERFAAICAATALVG